MYLKPYGLWCTTIPYTVPYPQVDLSARSTKMVKKFWMESETWTEQYSSEVQDYSWKLLDGVGKDKRKVVGSLVLLDMTRFGRNEKRARTTMYQISILLFLLLFLLSFAFLLFLLSSLTYSSIMPFIQSSVDPELRITPSLPLASSISDELIPNDFPSFSDKMNQTTALDQMNPYQLIALKAKQATKEREAKRKARILKRVSQGLGSGSGGVISSGGSSLGSGSFPRERTEWDSVQQASTSGSLTIPAPTTSTVKSSESRLGRYLHHSQSVPPNLSTTTASTTPPSSEQYQRLLNDLVPSPISTRENNISYDSTMEEEDDDADLKRLMNQAQAMLNISGKQAHSESESQENVVTPRVPTQKEIQMEGTSLLADPNDERR